MIRLESEALPWVSVLMPVRNEGSYLSQSLGAVLAQDYPVERYEVLVADGMSTDGTREIVQAYQTTHPSLRLIDNPGLIVSKGLNAAIAEARGDVIVRVDGHTVIAPDYVRRCVEELQTTGADNVGGRMVGVGENSFARAVTHATSHVFGVGGARFHYSEEREWVDTVYLGAWRRDVFDRIGLFDEELVRNQDDELNYRLRDHGGRVLLSPKIRSQYAVRSRPRTLFSQYFQYGFWKVRVMQKHPGQMRRSHFVPPIFVLALGGLAGLSLVSRAARKPLKMLLCAYLTALGLSTLDLSRRADHAGLRYVPIVFPLLHLGYGSGFLWGLVRFGRRWKEV
jgi:succinoglycan biosynthesis protein ExoA